MKRLSTSFYQCILMFAALLGGSIFALNSHSATIAAAHSGGKMLAEEFWAQKASVKLWIYRKHVDDGVKDKPLLFLVHGSSYSGKTMFDLSVPNRSDYSFMEHFARLGYDVWTMDHEGHGHSDRTKGLSDIHSGVEDLAVAMAVVKKGDRQIEGRIFRSILGCIARRTLRQFSS